ncbi:methionine--tRNA ligase [Candidatus Dojkabacteria bacterium]|uniref:Methionine--tRNA ligase n=1 Tax=Candidatus Dojkabacteria bacterium TaxID=2099670 RepID=A0A955LAD8_9BACT|nr:methionine--tRNA ligase [Candidatus Dojkabacteria bacterium]
MSEKYYQTTTLPYVNADPHIGHTLEFVQADVIARFKRAKLGEENVWFNLGADEHGLKMYQKAKEQGISPQEYVDQYSAKWKEFCKQFLISYDTFYRTSDKSHHKMAQEWWLKSLEKGDIYKKEYTGLYCVGCEEFKTEKDLVDGKCPDHGVPPIEVSEENYFFKLSKYKDNLLEWLDGDEILKPEHKKQELKNWITAMEDISISRVKEKMPWGIEVPNDSTQVMYVWFDALTDYINVLKDPKAFAKEGFDKKEGIDKWWPGVQFFGPDNLRFQGGVWQGMLASFGVPHTKKLLNHGMVLASDGTKMSKSKGNGVSPFEQAEKFGVEAVRFYLVAGISTFGDSPYKEEDLKNLYNAHLADNFGNLLNRVIVLANKYNIVWTSHDLSIQDKEFKSKVDEVKNEIEKLFEKFEIQNAVQEIIELASFGNEYISEKQPWSKDISEDDRVLILTNLAYLIKEVANLYSYIIPQSAKRALVMLENKESGVLFTKLD